MSEQLQEEELLRPLDRQKIHDLKALAHFVPEDLIPQRIKRYRFPNNQTMTHSFDLSSFVTNPHRIKIHKKKNQNKFLKKPGASFNQFKQQSSRQDKSTVRLDNGANFSLNIGEYLRERQRIQEFASVLFKDRRHLNERQIERNTECIKTEMDRRRTMTQFSKMENELVKGKTNESSANRTEFIQKLRQFSKSSHVQQYNGCRKNTCISTGLKRLEKKIKIPRIAFLANIYPIMK